MARLPSLAGISRLQVILLAALAVRLAHVLWGPEVPPQDTADYDEIARNLLSGEGFVARDNWFGHPMRSWRPPLYPILLAGVYGLVGYSHLAVKLVQVLLGTGTVWAVYAISSRLHPASAWLAAAVAVVYGPLVVSTNEIMSEALFTCLLTWTVFLTLEAGGAAATRRAVMAGMGVGLSALTRPVGLLLWPATLAVAALQGSGRWLAGGSARRAWLVRAAWLSAGVAGSVCPWTLRNAAVHGAFVPISTHGGFIIARSNSATADWRRDDGWQIREEVFTQTPSEVQRDRRWLRQGLQSIGDHPEVYLRLAGERFLRFWYFLTPAYNFWFMLVLPFGLAGMGRYARRPGFSDLAGFIALSLAVFTFVLYGSTRFRLPLEPLFIVFGAAFMRDLWDRRGARVGGIWAGAAVALNLLALWQGDVLRRVVLDVLAAGGLK